MTRSSASAFHASILSAALLSWMAAAAAVLLASCSAQPPAEDPAAAAPSMDAIAESYVRLVLDLGLHDGDYVDAYYGPQEWRPAPESAPRPVAEIRGDAEALIAALEDLRAASGVEDEPSEIESLRWTYLTRQLQSLTVRARMLEGEALDFDEESRGLYDAVAPRREREYFAAALERMDRRLEAEGLSEGSVIERLEAFRERFVIPADKVDSVFRTAIEACRERTLERLELPAEESFEVEYVSGKSWSAYNWYQGGYRSLIQVNLDLPIRIERAVDLACHEGYPGHHVYNALLEKHLVRDRGWVEGSVYALFSPQSLIAEGSANYGIDMVFSEEERRAYERKVLFPLAGLDASKADAYHEILELQRQLDYAGNEAARGYLDGELSAEEATEYLVAYAGMGQARAEQRLRFIDQYRSYVINYNLGRDLVGAYVDRLGGDDPDARWRVFGQLLSSPRLPSSLVEEPTAP
ncbi:MAG: hypothetical protein AAF725_20270 [Acidobacteriota bacterium]